MAPKQNIQSDLLVDGYTSHMFGTLDVVEYYVSLLKREKLHFQWHFDVMGAFRAPPPGLPLDQHDWVVDFKLKAMGPVIPQKIWSPKKFSDKVRRVNHEPLCPPIFFIRKNQDLGLPLIDAAGNDRMCFRGAEEAAPVGTTSTHAQIRINWCGYQHLDWNEQISIQRQTEAKETITLESFAKHVGRKVVKFMDAAKDEVYAGDQKYLIGDHRITPHDIILIGAVQVSQGSWMPILQLNDVQWYARFMCQ